MEEINNNTGENVQNEQKPETNIPENQNNNFGSPVNQNANPGYQNTGSQPNPNPVNPNAGFQNPGYQNQSFQNQGYQNQNFQAQQQYNPNYYQAPGYQNQGYQQNQNYQNGYQKPSYPNQGFQTPQGIPGLIYSLRHSGWATYYGVFKIVFGSLMSILYLIGLFSSRASSVILPVLLMLGLGVLLIISGVKTICISESMKRFELSKDTNRIIEAFNRLNQYFIVNSILSFIIILFIIICIIIGVDSANNFNRFYRF